MSNLKSFAIQGITLILSLVIVDNVNAFQYLNTTSSVVLTTPPLPHTSELPSNTIDSHPSSNYTANTLAITPTTIASFSHQLTNITIPHLDPNSTIAPPQKATITTYHGSFNTSGPGAPYANATATYSHWFTQANVTTARPGPTPLPVNLAPAIPPNIDPHDPVVLVPNKTINLYFQAPRPSTGSDIPMASVDIPKMEYPVVVLDHSALIADIECDLRKLRMKFLHRSALDAAENAWTMPKFVMMAFHEKCGRASRTGERDYLLVHGLKFDRKRLSVAADIKHIGVVEAVGKGNPITVDMGTYTPGSLNRTVGFDTQAPTMMRNGTRTNITTTPDFDVALDDRIGYTTLTGSALIVRRHSGLDPEVHLHIRGWFSKIAKAVKKVVKKIVSFIPSWTLIPLNKNIDIALGGGNVQTPFLSKKGYQLYSSGSGTNYIKLYCVDCGVNGVLNVKATVTFNLVGLITSGSFGVNGNLKAGLGLGVDANYAASIPAFSKTIVAIPLSPFTIPGLITIGPHLDFGVGASAGINAKGSAYAGIYLVWPAIHAQLNIYKSPEASGLIPQVVPVFAATGQVTMTASVFATVSLGFGVSILNGMKSFGVALVEKPELYVSGATTNPTCHGLRISAGLRNTVYADVFGKHHDINVWAGPSAGKCIAIRKRDHLALRAPISRRSAAKQIKTSDGTIGLHYADNGNVYALPHGNDSLVDLSTIFFSTINEGVITGDVESRIFHGYADTLDSIGVSRFRLSRPDHIPITALAVTLQQSDSPYYPNVLVALDSAHNVYYPVVCAFDELDFPRVFLTKNPEEGANGLMRQDVVDDITGVLPEVCEFVPFVSM